MWFARSFHRSCILSLLLYALYHPFWITIVASPEHRLAVKEMNVCGKWSKLSLRFMGFKLLIIYNNLWVDGVVVTHQLITIEGPWFKPKSIHCFVWSLSSDLTLVTSGRFDTRLEVWAEICASFLQNYHRRTSLIILTWYKVFIEWSISSYPQDWNEPELVDLGK